MTVKKRDLRSVSEHVQKEAVDMSVGKRRKIHHISIRLKIRKNWEEQGKLIGVTVDPNAKSRYDIHHVETVAVVGEFVSRF
jgi:hypothetical protein